MSNTITLDGEPGILAAALDAYITDELDDQAHYEITGKIVLEGICDSNVTKAAHLQEQLLHTLGRCEQHLTQGCCDPLPHAVCEI